ncbi:uncharacterized protein LOC117103879 isoform X5 [Anneissia japonica]|uniref:uncharacterized protein LOC117103879 isoform X5 n=1 Tax=Anneissia japonica TaxID=1529436 RepID=UPI001425B5B1|nr:uncharacterized protein LOC117103879 isoform X5 [Anneissia japonica]
MACFKAKFDYEKERDDVLSFKKGDLFEVTSKVDDRWWAARAESDNSVGYVPALYLEPVKDKPIGRLVPEGRIDTKEHDYHLEALAELQSKVRPLPAHVLGQALGISVPAEEVPPISHYKRNVVRDKGDEKDGGDEDEDEIPSFLSLPPPQEPPPPPDYDLNDEDILNEEGVPYHHQLNKTGRDSSSDDGQPTSPVNRAFLPADDNPVLIQAKPLPNPVKGSRMHKDLHFELKHSGRDVLKPELARVMTQRKHQKSKAELDAEKKAKRTSLEIKLQERQEILKQKDEKLKIPGEAIPEEEGQSELYRVRASLKSKEAAKT